MRRTLAVLATCAATAVAIAGCGDAGREQAADRRYVDEVNAAQSQFARRFDRLAADIGATITPAQGRRTLGAFERAVDRTVARLRRARPPQRVVGLHRRLVGEIASYGVQIAAARRAFGSRDPQRVLAAQAKLVTDVQRTSEEINLTIDAINRRLKS